MGPAIVGVEYSNIRFNHVGATSVAGLNSSELTYRGSASFNVGEVNLKYAVTSAFMVGAAYAYIHDSGASGASGAHYNQFDLGALYALSKRTSLYLVDVYQTASGRNSTGADAVAAINFARPSASKQQFVATAGIVQKF